MLLLEEWLAGIVGRLWKDNWGSVRERWGVWVEG